ncbi:MAG: hypothetical protein CMG74_04190 [Candidatus Marinimicrobia bacterium]|nr:hypothetical protein [Candidatus Neomarinimicrobiota bacterium]
MLEKSKQIRNSFIYMLPLGISSLLPVITIPIFTRILSPEDYGVLAIAFLYSSFICGLANFGISLAFERNYFKYSDNSEKLAQLLYSSLVFVITNFVVLALITYLFKSYISIILSGSAQYGTLILTSCVAQLFFSTINNFFFIFLKNEEKAKPYVLYRILSSIIYFIISLFLVAYIRIGIIGLVIAQMITGIILFILLSYLFLMKFNFSINKNILLESLKISYPLTPSIFLRLLGSQFDKYLISLLATMGGVGIYHIGRRVTDILFSLMTALSNVFGPQIYQRMFEQHEQGSESIGKYLTPFFYITILMAFILALLSEEVITIMTPISYHGAIPIITILCIYYISFFFEKILGMQITYMKKTHFISFLNICGIGLNIGLNIPFIMKYGAIGAAWATLLSASILTPISIIVAQHYYKINWEWKKISQILTIFFIGSFSTIFLYLLGTPYLFSLALKFIFMAVFLYLGVRYRIITKENYSVVKDAIFLKKLSLI